MALTDSLPGLYSGINVAQPLVPLWPSIPASSLELELLDLLDSKLPPCAPGYQWNDETVDCVPKISARAQKCGYGYKRYSRMDECRRIKYHHGPQQKGKFKKFWDTYIAPPPPPTTPKPPRQTPKTTLYTDGWYGYGYDFGKNDPHW